MKIGFTGRREGATAEQEVALGNILKLLCGQEIICIHNNGEGTDQLFGELSKALGYTVQITPDDLRPMPRNRFLVKEVDLIIAIPPTDHILKKGSGTWETIKYMWKKPGDTLIILSDGAIRETKEQFV